MTLDTVHIVGAGGIGCAVGYFLRAAGVVVVFVDADRDKVLWGRAHGVRVDRRPPLDAVFQTAGEWEPAPEATVLLCTKCYDNAAVLARLPKSVRLIPIQNGFDRSLQTHGLALEGIASFVSECLPGKTHTRITRGGRLHLGNDPVRAGALAEGLRRAPFGVRVVADILPYKYAKLMYNAAISPLAAAAGMDNGDLLRIRAARRLFFALLQENHAILHQAGVPLAKIGPFHPDTVAWILRHGFVSRALALVFYPTLRGTYCSMAGDIARGRTEIDNYNGHLLELAGPRPCPLNRRVHSLVRRMEQARMKPHPEALAELLAEEEA